MQAKSVKEKTQSQSICRSFALTLTVMLAMLVIVLFSAQDVQAKAITQGENAIRTASKNITSIKTTTWRKDGRNKWTANNLVTYVLQENYLFRQGAGKLYMLKKLPVNKDDYPSIAYAYANNIYITSEPILPDKYAPALYAYNIKTGKLRTVVKHCQPVHHSGKYIYGFSLTIQDAGPRPTYIWKISGDSVKLLRKIGNRVLQPQVVNGKLYYGSYPNSNMGTMKAVCANLDATNKKVLFTAKGPNERAAAILKSVTKTEVKVEVSYYDSNAHKSHTNRYTYNLKTKKLTITKG